MDSIFRDDILNFETDIFFKNTFLVSRYIKEHKYDIDLNDQKRIINDVKANGSIILPKGYLNTNEVFLTENLMKRCFSKCKQFVLEDWVDFDELDTTMKCTLLHKKSLEIMKETFKNI